MTLAIGLTTLGIIVAAVLLFAAAGSEGKSPFAALGRRIFEVPLEPLASIEERISTRERLEERYVWMTADDGDAAAFIFAEAEKAFSTTLDGIKNLDTKAGTLIGIVTTGLGAIAILGDSSKLPARTPFLFIGLAFLTIALFAAVLALPTRGLSTPRLSNYTLLSTLTSIDNKARIEFDLIEAWLDDTRRADAIAGGKARLLLIAVFAIVVGVVCLTANWSLGVSDQGRPTAVQNALPTKS